jgi:hypothetical protein
VGGGGEGNDMGVADAAAGVVAAELTFFHVRPPSSSGREGGLRKGGAATSSHRARRALEHPDRGGREVEVEGAGMKALPRWI